MMQRAGIILLLAVTMLSVLARTDDLNRAIPNSAKIDHQNTNEIHHGYCPLQCISLNITTVPNGKEEI